MMTSYDTYVARVRTTISFVFTVAYRQRFGERCVALHSFVDGIYFTDKTRSTFTKEEAKEITNDMRVMLRKHKVQETTIPRKDALAHFQVDPKKYEDKLALLKIWRADPLPIVRIGLRNWDIRFRDHETHVDVLISAFEVIPYANGLLLRSPSSMCLPSANAVGRAMPPFTDRARYFSVLTETQKWNDQLGIRNIKELNEKVYSKELLDLVLVAEGFHEAKISEVADHISRDFPEKRVVCIAGPSSSGKTTLAKRLDIQLRVSGHSAIQISMDDYYKDIEDVPILPDGNTDYDCLESINIQLLAERVGQLVAGDTIPTRKFDFFSHKGKDIASKPITATPDDIIIIEGIHGLNPEFTRLLGGGAHVNRVFISATQQLNIDHEHHISTADIRLLRRILRDHRTRGYPATETLERWPVVRASEDKYIFPFQEEADYCLNTALIYELPILANYIKPLLAEVRGDVRIEVEAERLLTFLNLSYPLKDEIVPTNSILREFTGGGVFTY